MTTKLDLDADALALFCALHHVRRLSLFGSVLKSTATPSSDADFLVEFETGLEPGLFALADMEAELSGLPGGRAVDLHTAQELSRYFRDDVVRTAGVPAVHT